MPTRVSLRRNGVATDGKKVALPSTLSDLLQVATRKLKLDEPAKRLFAADGM